MIRDTKLTVIAGVALGIMFCLLALLIGAVDLLVGHNPFQAIHVSVVRLLGASAVLGAAFGLPIGVEFWIQDRICKRSGKWR